MSVNISVQNIVEALCETHNVGEFHVSFDVVNIVDDKGAVVKLFFNGGVGHAVAAAINAALSEVLE